MTTVTDPDSKKGPIRGMRHTLTLTNCLIILIILVGFEFGVKVPSRKFGTTFFETLKLFFKKGFGLTTFCIVSGILHESLNHYIEVLWKRTLNVPRTQVEMKCTQDIFTCQTSRSSEKTELGRVRTFI